MRYTQDVIDYAASKGLAADELPMIINGCSGGLSWLYALGGRAISCERCCNIHDLDYQLGGSPAMRAEADKRLRHCAGAAGGWRVVRAWGMWVAVRLAGRWYWGG